MIFHAYDGEQRDLQWVTITMTLIATFLSGCRLTASFKNRGSLEWEDALVVTADVSQFAHC